MRQQDNSPNQNPFAAAAQQAAAQQAAAQRSTGRLQGFQNPTDQAFAPAFSAEQAIAYLKQVYVLLGASLFLAVAAGWVGMQASFAHEHPFVLMFMQLGAVFLAMKVPHPATLFLFTGLSGFALGPLIAVYVNAGMSAVVGQAAFMTAGGFLGLSAYAMTTKKDFSRWGGILFAGVIAVLVGGVVNMFLQSSALMFAMSAAGSVIFSALILFDTQQLRNNPWAIPPTVGALTLYLNIINLFIFLLQLMGFLGGDD
ncbi:MAG: Bax inhibitor-1/YccA family protein [Magnetococcales bacterium]|nr:Bax inhibitor-1/YccA family protein [Magnetococcales bacterium]